MLKILCCTLMTIFFVLGLISCVYLLILAFLRRKSKGAASLCIIPLSGNFNADVRSIMYAYERINLFGEDNRCRIIACDMGADCEEIGKIKNIFALCPNVKVIEREDISSYLLKYY